jgi:ActR/RegA family two-component response regulator
MTNISSSDFIAKKEYQVLVVEDEVQVCNELEQALASTGIKAYSATCQKDMQDLIRARQFDATSIDWQLGEHSMGLELVEYAKKQQSHLAQIIYSRYADQASRCQARKQFADDILGKSGLAKYDSEFLDTMVKASRLGRLRRVVNVARSSDPSFEGFDCLNLGFQSLNYEKQILDSASKEAEKLLSNADGDDAIRMEFWNRWKELGIVPELDMSRFMSATWREKYSALLSYLDLNLEYLSAVTECSVDDLNSIFSKQFDLGSKNSTIFRPIDQFYTLIAFVFADVCHEPGLMRSAFRNRCPASTDKQATPWADLGLYDFLLQKKMLGVDLYLRFNNYSLYE